MTKKHPHVLLHSKNNSDFKAKVAWKTEMQQKAKLNYSDSPFCHVNWKTAGWPECTLTWPRQPRCAVRNCAIRVTVCHHKQPPPDCYLWWRQRSAAASSPSPPQMGVIVATWHHAWEELMRRRICDNRFVAPCLLNSCSEKCTQLNF